VNRFGVIVFVLVRSAVRGMQGSPVTSAITVATIATALVLVGAFALLVSNMQGLMERFGEDLRVTVYLESGLSAEEQQTLADRVITIEGVGGVRLIDEAAALERFRSTAGGAALLEGLEGNPLPASLDIALATENRTPEGLEILRAALTGLPGVDEVAHGQDWVDGYARASSLVRTAGYVLGTVLCLATLLIVSNTIRLGVYAREDELDILDLVGASRTFVRVPFLLEGTLLGAGGGGVALVLLYASFHVLVPQIQYGLVFFLGSTAPHFFEWGDVFRLLVAGAGLGMLGSAAALMGRRS